MHERRETRGQREKRRVVLQIRKKKCNRVLQSEQNRGNKNK